MRVTPEALGKAALFVALAVPFAALVAGAFGGTLGANPVERITLQTGIWALRILLLTLAVTPLRKLTGWSWPVRMRRMLGLYAFFYALMHFTTYLWLDQFFDMAAIVEDIVKRPYITVGFTALCLLVPLAVTSTNAMIKRLGGRAWRRLHRLVYPAAVLVIVHFLWLVKADLRQPLAYGAILAVLLLARAPWRRMLYSQRTATHSS